MLKQLKDTLKYKKLLIKGLKDQHQIILLIVNICTKTNASKF